MGFLFGSKAPKPAEPTRMPVASTEEASRDASARRQREVMQRSGRRSTILSDRDSTGGAYRNSLLGQS